MIDSSYYAKKDVTQIVSLQKRYLMYLQEARLMPTIAYTGKKMSCLLLASLRNRV
jgi:hypothetical protein